MRFRHKIISLTSVAAALVIIVAVAAFAMGGLELGLPKEDIVAGQQLAAKPTAQPSASAVPLESVVYYTDAGNFFHSVPDCSGMQGAQAHSLREAYAAGKGACPACLSPETTLLPVTATPTPKALIYV